MGALFAVACATILGLLTSALDIHLLSFQHSSVPIVALVSTALWLAATIFVTSMFWEFL